MPIDGQLTSARTKYIDFKNAVQVALSILKEEEEEEQKVIYSICNSPCPVCYADNNHQSKELTIKYLKNATNVKNMQNYSWN